MEVDKERGRRADFDPVTGAVKGSGSGAGGGNPVEDYDHDAKSGDGGMIPGKTPDQDSKSGAGAETGKSGHPLPGSDEARHGEIPEHLEREKGTGDDMPEAVQPGSDPVNPDGEPYHYDDLGRGPGSPSRKGDENG
jgi:hypothetical protein